MTSLLNSWRCVNECNPRTTTQTQIEFNELIGFWNEANIKSRSYKISKWAKQCSIEIHVSVSLHKRQHPQQIEDKSFGTTNPNWDSHGQFPFSVAYCTVYCEVQCTIYNVYVPHLPNIYSNCSVWIFAWLLFKLILTASLCIGCTANIIPAIIAKLSWRPATMMQTRVNSTQTMACIKIFVKWNQIGFKPNK